MALLAITLDRRFPAAGPSAGFLRLYPISIAILSATALAASMLLWVWDFRFVPPMLLGRWEPRTWCLFAIPLFAFTLGTYSLIAFQVTKRSVYAHVYAAVPIAVAIATPLAYPASWLETRFRFCLPSFFPRMPYTLAAVAVLAAAYFVARWLWARFVDESRAASVAALVVGAWCWALMSRGTASMLMLFHHLCLTDSYVQVQHLCEEWTTVFFAVLWCAIGFLNLGRSHRPVVGVTTS